MRRRLSEGWYVCENRRMTTILFFLGLTSAQAFFGIDYLKKCGGNVYPACDSKELNQAHIFEAARAEAKKTKKGLLVILGADWCKPCRELDAAFQSDKTAREALEKRFVVVKLAASKEERGPAGVETHRMSSIKAVAKTMHIQIDSFPTAYIVSPSTGKAVDEFPVGGIKPKEIDELAFRVAK